MLGVTEKRKRILAENLPYHGTRTGMHIISLVESSTVWCPKWGIAESKLSQRWSLRRKETLEQYLGSECHRVWLLQILISRNQTPVNLAPGIAKPIGKPTPSLKEVSPPFLQSARRGCVAKHDFLHQEPTSELTELNLLVTTGGIESDPIELSSAEVATLNPSREGIVRTLEAIPIWQPTRPVSPAGAPSPRLGAEPELQARAPSRGPRPSKKTSKERRRAPPPSEASSASAPTLGSKAGLKRRTSASRIGRLTSPLTASGHAQSWLVSSICTIWHMDISYKHMYNECSSHVRPCNLSLSLAHVCVCVRVCVCVCVRVCVCRSVLREGRLQAPQHAAADDAGSPGRQGLQPAGRRSEPESEPGPEHEKLGRFLCRRKSCKDHSSMTLDMLSFDSSYFGDFIAEASLAWGF